MYVNLIKNEIQKFDFESHFLCKSISFLMIIISLPFFNVTCDGLVIIVKDVNVHFFKLVAF